MVKLLFIAGTGGFIGTVARFLVSRYVQNLVFTTFPIGTFLVNIIGCLVIGLLYGLSDKGDILTPEWRLFLTVGFCGGFTTFSTFSGENFALLRDGNFFYLALYAGLSVFLGLVATWFGYMAITRVIS